MLYPFELVEIPALGLTKLSFVFFFRRVFNTRIKRWYDILTSGMIITTTAWTIGFFFAFLFICSTKPRSYWESPKLELADCVRTQKLHNALVVSDVILDVVIISMSIPIVCIACRLSLHVNWQLMIFRCGVLIYLPPGNGAWLACFYSAQCMCTERPTQGGKLTVSVL